MPGEKILIIDTEKNVLLTYKTVLEEEGYHVDLAMSIPEALNHIATTSYAVLVTELISMAVTFGNLPGAVSLEALAVFVEDTRECPQSHGSPHVHHFVLVGKKMNDCVL